MSVSAFEDHRFLDCTNVGTLPILPYNVVEYTGITNNVITVRIPTKAGITNTALNGEKTIIPGAHGRCTFDFPAVAKYASIVGSTPAHGQVWSVGAGNGELLPANSSLGGFSVLGQVDTGKRRMLVERAALKRPVFSVKLELNSVPSGWTLMNVDSWIGSNHEVNFEDTAKGIVFLRQEFVTVATSVTFYPTDTGEDQSEVGLAITKINPATRRLSSRDGHVEVDEEGEPGSTCLSDSLVEDFTFLQAVGVQVRNLGGVTVKAEGNLTVWV